MFSVVSLGKIEREIIDAEDHKLLSEQGDHEDATTSCFTIIRDQYLVTGDYDKKIRVWDIHTGKYIPTGNS